MFVNTDEFGKLRITFTHERNDLHTWLEPLDNGYNQVHVEKIKLNKKEINSNKSPRAHTICKIFKCNLLPEKKEGQRYFTNSEEILSEGVATCHPNDNFDKKIGRKNSLLYALAGLKFKFNGNVRKETIQQIVDEYVSFTGHKLA